MKYMSKGIRLMQLALFLFIAAHTHEVAAYEVVLNNMTPNNYKVEFKWITKSGEEYSNSFFCRPNTECKKIPYDNGDPKEHDYVPPKLTGEVTILKQNMLGYHIVSRRQKRPENQREYRCLIRAYIQDKKAIFTYIDGY